MLTLKTNKNHISKGLLAVGYAKYGKEEELKKNPIRHLFDVYVTINREANENEALHEEARAYFKKMEDGDPQTLSLWERFRTLSIEEYKKLYAYVIKEQLNLLREISLLLKHLHIHFTSIGGGFLENSVLHFSDD
jgi:hypothetical protein